MDYNKIMIIECYDGVTRTVTWARGVGSAPGLPKDFCERNCKYFKKCGRIRNPKADGNFGLMKWCCEQDVANSFYPSSFEPELPDYYDIS